MVLLLNKDWMAYLEGEAERRYGGVGALTGEEKALIWLQAWTAVQQGTACWNARWMAVTYGAGPEGTDGRFRDGRLQGPRSLRGG